MQSTGNILLIRPANFGFNEETSLSNAFQNTVDTPADAIHIEALKEFDLFAKTLIEKGVNVLIADDTTEPIKPDAIFPNNWVSFHADGKVILYPMFAPNRRLERRMDIIASLKEDFDISNVIDLSGYEQENIFLEGTGSIIFDRHNGVAYACLSPRTDKMLFEEVCRLLNYTPVSFYSYDKSGKEVYHTNVMMCIADEFAVICLESITNLPEREIVLQKLISTGHTIVEISYEQMNQFAGNMLSVKTSTGKNLLVLSASALKSLTDEQRQAIEKFAILVQQSINTIETVGGGSARCMMAEVFLPAKNR
ncbi:MAG: amidinotransferase [Chitinophagaceae bacterium]|nr:amidinotransferase [Chitinophagaceae bacterium]